MDNSLGQSKRINIELTEDELKLLNYLLESAMEINAWSDFKEAQYLQSKIKSVRANNSEGFSPITTGHLISDGKQLGKLSNVKLKTLKETSDEK